MRILIVAVLTLFALPLTDAIAQSLPRGRELGIPFPGKTGQWNAITDVPGVAVGHVTLILGDGALVPGKGPIRTGVTAILPRPRGDWDFVMAGTFNLNGNGDMTGTNWVKESGFLEGPILITGTHSVGTVRDAAIKWQESRGRDFIFTYPLVAETFDALNDANGGHVKPEHAWAALDSARVGPVPEGGVGGGTGMGCNGFKGGIGTSSRIVSAPGGKTYTLGVLVQCNYGGDLHILGAPVGREITDLRYCSTIATEQTRAWLRGLPKCGQPSAPREDDAVAEQIGRGSIIVIVATDAPMLPHQLERISRRVAMGLGKLGSLAGNGSGDLFLSFSTANRSNAASDTVERLTALPNERMNPFFQATIDATEEAVVNAMLAAETMVGVDGMRASHLPGDRVMAALRKYGRIQ